MKRVLEKLKKNKKTFEKIKNLIFNIFYVIINLTIYFALSVAIVSLFIEIVSPTRDVKTIISIAEEGTIITATLALLTFTYALAIESKESKDDIIKIGKYFLRSTLYFIVGIIFLTWFGEIITKTSINLAYQMLVGTLGLVILFGSVIFFVVGITNLLQNLDE